MRLRNVLEQVAGAERAHILLIAGERQDHLSAPRIAMLGKQRRGKDRAGKSALHVRDAASVEPAVAQRPAEGRRRPARAIADRECVEMTVEYEAPAWVLGRARGQPS